MKNKTENKFNKNYNYENLCMIFSPYGIIKEGTILSGEKWMEILIFDVGNDFNQMFKVYDEK